MRAIVAIIITLLRITCTCWSSWDISLKLTNEIDEAIGGESFSVQPNVAVYDKKGLTLQTDFVGDVSAHLHHSAIRLGRFQNNTCLEKNEDDYFTRAPIVRGIARFNGLCINKANKDYRIRYIVRDEYGLSLANVLGGIFMVTVGPAFRIGMVTQPNGAFGGIPWAHQPTLSIQDKGGNTLFNEWEGTVRP